MTQEIRIRRWLAFLLAALLAFSTLSTALAAGKTFQSYQTTSMSNVNLRKRANGTSTILKRIKVGDTVTVVGKSGNYYQIQFDGKEGYALIKYIDGTDSGADPEPDESLMHAVPLAVTSYPYDTTTLGYVKLRKKSEPHRRRVSHHSRQQSCDGAQRGERFCPGGIRRSEGLCVRQVCESGQHSHGHAQAYRHAQARFRVLCADQERRYRRDGDGAAAGVD